MNGNIVLQIQIPFMSPLRLPGNLGALDTRKILRVLGGQVRLVEAEQIRPRRVVDGLVVELLLRQDCFMEGAKCHRCCFVIPRPRVGKVSLGFFALIQVISSPP